MANWRLIVDHVKVSEGGHSADPDDRALAYGHSGVKGGKYDPRHPNDFIHTNKGIIWATYSHYKKLKGQTPSPNEFINMSDTLWLDIMRTLFWNKVLGDSINSQGVAEILFEAAWGGGLSGMVRAMQTKLKNAGYKGANGKPLVVDGGMGKNTLFALNNYTKNSDNEKSMIEFLTAQRLKYLQSLSTWWKYKHGWTDRVNKVYARAVNFIGQNTGTISAIGILFVVGIAYVVLKDKIKF